MTWYVMYKGKVPGVYDNWENVGGRYTISAAIATRDTTLWRRRKLDTPTI
jgi:hypothetical protein